MPNYDYKCTECESVFEFFQKMTDPLIEKCPNCSGKLKRLIGSGAGPIFKGAGFYQTDYKNSKSSHSKPSGKFDNTTKPNEKKK